MGRRYNRGPFDAFDNEAFGGVREIRIPRPPRRFWLGLGFVAAALLVLIVGAPIIGFLTEVQWYQALGLRDVYLSRVGLEFALFGVSLAIALAFAAANAAVALRVRRGPALRAVGIRRRWALSGSSAAGMGAAGLIALILSAGAGSRWQNWVLLTHYTATGHSEPVFGMDASFYMLTLPFLHDITNWVFGLVFITTVLVTVLYAWRGDTFDLALSPRALAHVSVLLALIAVVFAITVYLERFDLAFAHNGVVWGPGYTDVHVRSGLALGRVGLALLLALVLLANVAVRRPVVLVGAVVAWVAGGLVAGLYPAAVQRFVVTPAELSQESPYIQRELDFTRRAYGVDHVETRQFGGAAPLTAQAVADDHTTIENLRLWDYKPLQDTYQQLQSIRTYYAFKDIDLDRYTIAGRTQQLELSARELDSAKLQQQAQSWVNLKLQYTHGYGVAASPVSAVAGEGLPTYVASDIPTSGPLKVERPQIYFGETGDDFVLAPSLEPEFDYPKGAENVRTTYAGTHGVRLNGANRALWALRTGDTNLLISSQLQDRTEILYRRNIQDRVHAIAPFLQLDSDPYIVVAPNGRLYWIQDAYTTASTYPYSFQEAGGENYIRNSVKVVIDAYEGNPDFYVADPADPLIRAYQGQFPTLFRPLSALPAGLRSHLRVPQHLFEVQSSVYRAYHIADPQVFYNREDVWDTTLEPYYVEMRLPGETAAEYLLILPFTPLKKQNLVSLLAVRNDPEHYGQLIDYVLPKDRVVFGPQQVMSRIQNTPVISRDYSLLNTNGSSVVQGNLLAVPIGDSFLYFQPWYLRATNAQSLPELKKVIMADATGSTAVAYQDSLKSALDQLVGEAVQLPGQPTPPGPPGTPSPPVLAPKVADLVAQASQLYTAAQDALKKGDLATYQKDVDEVGRLLQQIQALEQGAPVPPSPATSPGTSSPRPTP